MTHFTSAQEQFVNVALYNWGKGLNYLKTALKKSFCDKATALMIYWRCDPSFYYKYETVELIPKSSLDNFELMKSVENRLIHNHFPELISYSPDKDRVPTDPNLLEKIPSELIKPTKGKINGEILTEKFIYLKALLDGIKNGDLQKTKDILDKSLGIIDMYKFNLNPIRTAVENSHTAIAEYLLSKGVNTKTKAPNSAPGTLLSSAIYSPKNDLVKLLLNHGCDINEEIDEDKNTVLHVVVKRYVPSKSAIKKQQVLIKLLLKNGANPNKENIAGLTPKTIAKINENQELLDIINNN